MNAIIDTESRIATWLKESFDEETRTQIRFLQQNDPKELYESFYADLDFGTGGMRGIMGVGPNRMNRYTVGAATQGLANYLHHSFSGQEISVAIAYDCRNNSEFFAQIAASVLSANGIKVWLSDQLRPTPELSYAVRELRCNAGIVITASHNPKEYNGYKVYWDDGGQLVPPHDKNLIDAVRRVKIPEEIRFTANSSLISLIDQTFDQQYLKAIKSVQRCINSVAWASCTRHYMAVVFIWFLPH